MGVRARGLVQGLPLTEALQCPACPCHLGPATRHGHEAQWGLRLGLGLCAPSLPLGNGLPVPRQQVVMRMGTQQSLRDPASLSPCCPLVLTRELLLAKFHFP